MADLIIVAFPDETTAFAAADALVALQAQHSTTMEDVVVVTRGTDSLVHLDQSVNLTTGKPIGGGRWGTLVGLLFLNPLADAGMGLGSVGLADRFGAMGLDQKFLDDLVHSLDQGGAAVGMLNRRIAPDMVLDRLRPFLQQGRVIQTSLDQKTEARLTEYLEEMPPLHFPQDPPGGGRA